MLSSECPERWNLKNLRVAATEDVRRTELRKRMATNAFRDGHRPTKLENRRASWRTKERIGGANASSLRFSPPLATETRRSTCVRFLKEAEDDCRAFAHRRIPLRVKSPEIRAASRNVASLRRPRASLRNSAPRDFPAGTSRDGPRHREDISPPANPIPARPWRGPDALSRRPREGSPLADNAA